MIELRKENERQIDDLPYTIDEYGTVRSYNTYNNKTNEPRILKQFTNKKGYMYADLGNHKRIGIHQEVAKHFVPKRETDEVLEVHHKDNNPQNNHYSNLEWVTHKENLEHSYKTMSPVRNFRRCRLFTNDEFIDDFQSIKAACRFAHENFGVSMSSLEKYRRSGNCRIEIVDVTTIREE